MNTTNECDQIWWDELDVKLRTLDVMQFQPRFRLTDTTAKVPREPGVYGFFAVGLSQFRQRGPARGGDVSPLENGTFPCYIGCARSLSERLARHRVNCAQLPGLGGGECLHVAVLETPSHAAALYVEKLFLDLLRPLFNEKFLSGLGQRSPGADRISVQRESAFGVLFPGRQLGVRPREVSAELLLRRARTHLAEHSGALWPPLTRTSPT